MTRTVLVGAQKQATQAKLDKADQGYFEQVVKQREADQIKR